MSDVSSVCSEVLTPRSHRAMLSPRSRTPRGHLEDGRHLPRGHHEHGRNLAKGHLDDMDNGHHTPRGHTHDGRPPRPPGKGSADTAGDMGIVGVPRPRAKRGLCKLGSQYSSTLSVYSEIVENSRNMLYKSDSMVSLRERLLKNQESWTQLLDDDPTIKLRERGSQVDLSKVGLSLSPRNNNDTYNNRQNLSLDKSKFDKLQELEISLEKMAAGLDVKVTPREPLHVDVHDGTRVDYKNPIINGNVDNVNKRVLIPARRFASPDSHDSAGWRWTVLPCHQILHQTTLTILA